MTKKHQANGHSRTLIFIFSTFLIFLFTVLNVMNVVPHYNYGFLHQVISEPNKIDGRSIQLIHNGALTHDWIDGKNSQGLSLRHLHSLSIFGNTRKVSSAPHSIQLKHNSILYSNKNGLHANIATEENQTLQFDGERIFWGIKRFEMDALENGSTFIGNNDINIEERQIKGDVIIDFNGHSTLADNVCTDENFEDSSILVEHAFGEVALKNNNLLTSHILKSVWSETPQLWHISNTLIHKGPSTNSSLFVSLPNSTFNFDNVLDKNGFRIILRAYGKVDVHGGTTAIGSIIHFDTEHFELKSGEINIDHYDWNFICVVQRLSSTQVHVSSEINGPSGVQTYISNIKMVKDFGKMDLSIGCQSSETVDGVICYFSSTTIERPRRIRYDIINK